MRSLTATAEHVSSRGPGRSKNASAHVTSVSGSCFCCIFIRFCRGSWQGCSFLSGDATRFPFRRRRRQLGHLARATDKRLASVCQLSEHSGQLVLCHATLGPAARLSAIALLFVWRGFSALFTAAVRFSLQLQLLPKIAIMY